MAGKSLTEIKEAELADARARMAAERLQRAEIRRARRKQEEAEEAERLLFDVHPHDFWWRIDEWTRRFKKLTKWLSALVGLIAVAGGVPVAIAGLRAWRARSSVAPADPAPHPGERLTTDRVQEPDAGRQPPK
ncbi:MAG TPA: hypothetical protein VHG72_14085 [Polyangia bacterium]|nr:hypothetical protein [Polyangia bacterium]